MSTLYEHHSSPHILITQIPPPLSRDNHCKILIDLIREAQDSRMNFGPSKDKWSSTLHLLLAYSPYESHCMPELFLDSSLGGTDLHFVPLFHVAS